MPGIYSFQLTLPAALLFVQQKRSESHQSIVNILVANWHSHW
jgi:hypothetical protein